MSLCCGRRAPTSWLDLTSVGTQDAAVGLGNTAIGSGRLSDSPAIPFSRKHPGPDPDRPEKRPPRTVPGRSAGRRP